MYDGHVAESSGRYDVQTFNPLLPHLIPIAPVDYKIIIFVTCSSSVYRYLPYYIHFIPIK